MRTRAAVAALAVLLLAAPARAEETDEARRDALLAADWFKKGGWFSDLEKAKAEAKQSKKQILAYFTLTFEPSPYSRDIEKSLFSDEKFQEWGKKFVLYCQLTWKKDGERAELAAAKGQEWPWFAFLDAQGGLLLPLRPMKALPGFEEAGERILRYVELSRKAQKGGDPEKRDFVIATLDLGRITAEDARKRLAGLGELTEEQDKALQQAETNALVSGISIATRSTDQPALVAAGRKFLELKKAGKPLPTSRGDFQAFWLAIQKVAVADKDAALYEEAYLALKARYGEEASAKGFFEKCAKTLEEMKAASK